MNEQVPEMDDARTKEWTAFEKFRDYRGKLGEFESLFTRIFTDKKFAFYSDTVANFKRNCGGILGADLVVLGVKVMQLIRDGQQDYAHEVLRALYRKNYKLPCEISPGKLVPYTLVMLEPKKTVAIIRWVLSRIFPEELIYYYHPERKCHDRPISQENGKIHEALPSLWKYVQIADKESMIHSNNDFVRLAYAEDVLQKYISEIVSLYDAGGKGLFLNHSPQNLSYNDAFSSDCEGINVRFIWKGFEEIPDDLLHFSRYLAFIVKGEQEEIRGKFPRTADIATWQLRLPENNFPDEKFHIGIHEVNAHQNWCSKWPMFVNKGEACSDLRAIAIPNMHGELAKEYALYNNDNFLHNDEHVFQVLFDVSNIVPPRAKSKG
jgi:hypothetical protein